MNRPLHSLVIGSAVIAFGMIVMSCGDSNVETVQKGQQSASKSAQQSANAPASNSAAGAAASAAGVSWTIPAGWEVAGPRPMRAATYMIGAGEKASECAVFFFGTGQGGDVQANINRWIGQFQQPDGSDSKSKAKTEQRQIGNFKTSIIDLTGTYMSGGMGGQATVPKSGFRLLGAIIEAPEGPLFFKLTGPAAAIEEIKPHFDNLVASLKKS